MQNTTTKSREELLLIQEMRKAVSEVPSYIERFKREKETREALERGQRSKEAQRGN
jgi:hypothetical protein